MQHIVLPQGPSRRLSFFLAMEEYVAEVFGSGFFVWSVDPTVIIGRNQDLPSELDRDFCLSNGIDIIRRHSGGGCVYADRGNLMISCITRRGSVEAIFPEFLERLASFLRGLGLDAVRTERNDVTVGGRKVSGSAFFAHPSASIVHATLLLDTDFSMMARAITPPAEKLERHGVKSVRSRVANLSEFSIRPDAEAMEMALCREFCDSETILSDDDIQKIEVIEESYRKLDFILGKEA